jgi:hypothetical protein
MIPKAVITIFQCKRVILPHFFIKNIYPQMKASFPGEMKLYLIQHIPRGGANCTKSANMSDDNLKIVREWTDNGMFDGADIIQHSDFCERDAVMPTYRRGVKLALDESANFHLWLEDDALVFDRDCGSWPVTLKDKDVGVYRNYDMINCAFFVGTPSYEKRIYDIMLDESKWDMMAPFWLPDRSEMDINAPKIEPILTKNCLSRSIFDESYAGRIHKNHIDSFNHMINIMHKANPEQSKKFMKEINKQWKSENE